jgi:ABC-type multidrug transport system fused ATPase/permease subunit
MVGMTTSEEFRKQTTLYSSGWRRVEADFLRSRRPVLVLALLGLLAQAALLLPVPLMQGQIIDRLAPLVLHRAADPHASGLPVSLQVTASDRTPGIVALLVAAIVACHVGRLALGWKISATISRITLEVVRELTDALHRKLQRLEIGYFDREPTGCIMARLTSDVGSLLLFLSGGSLQLITDFILAMAILVFLFWLEWRLAFVGMVAMPLFIVNHRWFSRSIRDLSLALREQVSELYALLSERVPAVRVVRSFVKEEAELADFDARLDAQRSLNLTCMRRMARQGAWSTLIQGLGTVCVLACGAVLIDRGRLTVGELLAFSALLSQIYQPLVRLLGAQAMLAATMVAVDRIVEVLDEPEARARGPGLSLVRRPNARIVYSDVSFAFPRGASNVLDRISLAIEPGMTLGVMGASGSGKSTLLALLPRIYDLAEGEGSILFDGQDVRGIDLPALRRTVALVPQHAILFKGTIRSNLVYAAPDANSRAIERALELTDLAEWVASLPKGIDTPVSERGQSLSGGQRQRLALARAVIADPAVLLLDDCTSALDSGTESRIHARLEEAWLDRIRVIVSHTVTSIRDADRIIVLDGARLIEDGTHSALVRQGGYYAESYRQQTSVVTALRKRPESVPLQAHCIA